jgi:hypothetical protein
MFNKRLIFSLVIVIITLLFFMHISYGKITSADPCDAVCGGSGKRCSSVGCCVDYPDCTYRSNCNTCYDPPFPFIKYESSAINYPTKNYVALFLLSILIFFFSILLISKSRLFIWKLMSKFFQIKPQIIQTKCKYYSSYWLRKFKNYL